MVSSYSMLILTDPPQECGSSLVHYPWLWICCQVALVCGGVVGWVQAPHVHLARLPAVTWWGRRRVDNKLRCTISLIDCVLIKFHDYYYNFHWLLERHQSSNNYFFDNVLEISSWHQGFWYGELKWELLIGFILYYVCRSIGCWQYLHSDWSLMVR